VGALAALTEADQERRRLEALLGRTPATRLTAEDVKALVASLQDITATLAAADPADKAKVYAEMGIDIIYHQAGRVVVESRRVWLSRWCRRTVPRADYTDAGAGDCLRGLRAASTVRTRRSGSGDRSWR